MALINVKGLISPKGIIVNGESYSCSKAIREQWFQQVIDTGSIEVDVYLDKDRPQDIILVLSVGAVHCLHVRKDCISAERQQIYFDHMARLKQDYRNKKRLTI